jgi:hypothetical protein
MDATLEVEPIFVVEIFAVLKKIYKKILTNSIYSYLISIH